MTIKDINLDNLDMYEYQELLYTLIHYYNSLFHVRMTLIEENVGEENE